MLLQRALLTSNFRGSLLQIAKRSSSSKGMSQEDDVIFTEVKDKGIITLNRPKALNALNLSMVLKIYPKLQQWEQEKSFILIKGAGEKAFCSGGDIKAIVVAGLKGDKGQLGREFFKKEYLLNGVIGTYGKPYIAFIDGIVMGGGVGLSVHGHYRVVTERSVFAMPETAIGLFPDVGGSYALPRLGGKLGIYLALSGHRLKGSDVLKAGIGTHYCHSSKLGELESALMNCGNDQDIKQTLNKFNENVPDFSLAPFLSKIDTIFAHSTIEGILRALESEGSKWAKETHGHLLNMSPTSLKIALKELQLGSSMNLQECLQMEYRIAVGCLNNKDFYEGVRALLIDKDQNPKWDPKTLADVTEDYINTYFKKLPEDKELRHKL